MDMVGMGLSCPYFLTHGLDPTARLLVMWTWREWA